LKHIVFTDCHIEESCLEELDKVFTEILRYSKEAPILVCVGDYYEKKNPSAREIEFGTKWAIKFLSSYKMLYMVTGNHPAIDYTISSVTYLKHLGVEVVDDIVLDGVYYGHFMIKESTCGFNEPADGVDLSNNYKLSVLGHQHSYQVIDYPNGSSIVHPGSVRYVDFGEVDNKNKYILFVDECGFKAIRLTKVRPMVEVNSVADLFNIPQEYQVRVVINDFGQFLKEANDLEKYKSHFFKFKIKLNFQNNPVTNIASQNNDTTEIINKWIDNIKDIDVKAEIINEFKKVGICI